MKLVLALLSAGLLASSCGPPPSSCCGPRTTISRDVVYTGTLPSPDGGTPTTVRVSVSTSGNTTVTFVNGGHEIVEGFDGVVIPGP